MTYDVRFPNHSIEKKFNKFLLKIPQAKTRDEVMESIEKLSDNPRPYGAKTFKKLKAPVQFYKYTAQYRLRIGDYRVLYDIDDNREIVWILAIRKRNERTYTG
ncbi:MAG: type II toxin-antitoxin system RelE/ParE family toxin [bacterium]|nr:type II toxin-antitoxin system RelE/ParE family toxin [bacterium]